jgi:hypothetical protein
MERSRGLSARGNYGACESGKKAGTPLEAFLQARGEVPFFAGINPPEDFVASQAQRCVAGKCFQPEQGRVEAVYMLFHLSMSFPRPWNGWPRHKSGPACPFAPAEKTVSLLRVWKPLRKGKRQTQPIFYPALCAAASSRIHLVISFSPVPKRMAPRSCAPCTGKSGL